MYTDFNHSRHNGRDRQYECGRGIICLWLVSPVAVRLCKTVHTFLQVRTIHSINKTQTQTALFSRLATAVSSTIQIFLHGGLCQGIFRPGDYPDGGACVLHSVTQRYYEFIVHKQENRELIKKISRKHSKSSNLSRRFSRFIRGFL